MAIAAPAPGGVKKLSAGRAIEPNGAGSTAARIRVSAPTLTSTLSTPVTAETPGTASAAVSARARGACRLGVARRSPPTT